MFGPDDFPPLSSQKTPSRHAKRSNRRNATKSKTRQAREDQDLQYQDQAHQDQAHVVALQADFAHAMIMTAIISGNAAILQILFDGVYDTAFLPAYLICATLQSVPCMREVLRHMGPVRDTRVMHLILKAAKSIPTDCFNELIRTVVPNMTQEYVVNNIAIQRSSIYDSNLVRIIVHHLRTINDRQKFPRVICRHLFEGCELFTNIKFNRYGKQAQHTSCYNCVSEASRRWTTEIESILKEHLEIEPLVNLVYEYASDFQRLIDRIPVKAWMAIEEFGGFRFSNPLVINQVGYEVTRIESEQTRSFLRIDIQYKPITRTLDIINLDELDQHPIIRNPITPLVEETLALSISRGHYNVQNHMTPSHISRTFTNSYALNFDNIIGWEEEQSDQ